MVKIGIKQPKDIQMKMQKRHDIIQLYNNEQQ
jgi:hypothetical protein